MAQEGTKAWDIAIKSGDQPLPTEVAFAALRHLAFTDGGEIAEAAEEEERFEIVALIVGLTSLYADQPAPPFFLSRNGPGHPGDSWRPQHIWSLPVHVRLHKSFLQPQTPLTLLDRSLRLEYRIGFPTLEALGLDSLDLAQIRADTTQLGKKLPPLAYFANTDRTLGELAALLRDHFFCLR